MPYLHPILQAFIYFSYNAPAFCYRNMDPIRKQGTMDYSDPRAWQPIALLNTLGQGLESVIAQRILTLAEEHSLLLAKAHRGPPKAGQ